MCNVLVFQLSLHYVKVNELIQTSIVLNRLEKQRNRGSEGMKGEKLAVEGTMGMQNFAR